MATKLFSRYQALVRQEYVETGASCTSMHWGTRRVMRGLRITMCQCWTATSPVPMGASRGLERRAGAQSKSILAIIKLYYTITC